MVTVSSRFPDFSGGTDAWEHLREDERPSNIASEEWRRISYEAAHIGSLRKFVGDDTRDHGDEPWKCGYCYGQVIPEEREDQSIHFDQIVRTNCVHMPHFFHRECCKSILSDSTFRDCPICQEPGMLSLVAHTIITEDMATMDQAEKDSSLFQTVRQERLSERDLEMIEALLEHGANPEAIVENMGCTIHAAAVNGHTTVLQKILQQEVDLEQRAIMSGYTPLLLATFFNRINTVQLLVENGANINAPTPQDNDTALLIACRKGNTELAELLMSLNANINRTNLFGRAALHYTCLHGNFPLSRSLIEKGANTSLADFEKRTPLHMTLHHGRDMGDNGERLENFYSFFEFLLDKIENINEGKDVDGRSFLHYAIECRGSIRATKLLLERGARVNEKTRGDATPLHIAAGVGSTELVKLLLDNGADVDERNLHGFTPLSAAAHFGHSRVAVQLMRQGANPWIFERRYSTPFARMLSRGLIAPLLLSVVPRPLRGTSVKAQVLRVTTLTASVVLPLVALRAKACADEAAAYSESSFLARYFGPSEGERFAHCFLGN